MTDKSNFPPVSDGNPLGKRRDAKGAHGAARGHAEPFAAEPRANVPATPAVPAAATSATPATPPNVQPPTGTTAPIPAGTVPAGSVPPATPVRPVTPATGNAAETAAANAGRTPTGQPLAETVTGATTAARTPSGMNPTENAKPQTAAERRDALRAAAEKRKQEEREAQRRAEAAAPKQATIGELFSRLSDQIRYLVKGEIDLAKAKAQLMVKKLGVGAGLLAAAGILALYLLGVLIHAAILGFSVIMPPWAAALTVAGILLVIILILALVGKSQLTKAQEDKPEPQVGLKKSAEAAKEGFKK